MANMVLVDGDIAISQIGVNKVIILSSISNKNKSKNLAKSQALF